MRAYVECSPNQPKNCTLSTCTFPSNDDETLKILEKCWLFLYWNFTGLLQFTSTSPHFIDGYHYCMCTNIQLFLKYINRYPSACVD